MFTADTHGTSVRNATMKNVNFSGRQTLRMNYEGSQYIDCTLEYIDSRWSYLGGLVFRNCILTGADFEYCRMDGTPLDGARLAPTRFENCGKLTGTNFSNVDMTGVQFTGDTSLQGAFYNIHTVGLSASQKQQMVDITLKTTSGAVHPLGQQRKFTVSNIQKTEHMVERSGAFHFETVHMLKGVNLTDAKLAGLDLMMKSLAGSILTGADLSGANLNGTDFSNATLDRVKFNQNKRVIEADFSHARLAHLDLSGVDFTRSNFSGAQILDVHTDSNVNPAGADAKVTTFFQNVDFNGATIGNSRFKFTSFSGANFANATIGDDVNNSVHARPADANQSIQNAGALLGNDFRNARFNDRTYWVLWLYRSVPQIGAQVARKGLIDIGDADA